MMTATKTEQLKPIPDWLSPYTSFVTNGEHHEVFNTICATLQDTRCYITSSKQRKITIISTASTTVYRLFRDSADQIVIEAMRVQGCVVDFITRLQTVKKALHKLAAN